jgi:nucleoside-diphosphate-sugar epimerase
LNKILITGSSGFVGSEIFKILSKDNLIYTLNRKAGTYKSDLAIETPSIDIQFDVVIHCAGLSHNKEIHKLFEVNVNGLKNLLKGLKNNEPSHFVFISSVSIYGSKNGQLLNEQTPILAADLYGMSKIQAEAEIIDWCRQHDVICTILRLPLVYGENPPGNLKAMIQGIKKGYYFNIAGGQARKSMVRAEDVARFILPASEVGGIYHLTDGQHPNFFELSHKIGKAFGRNRIPNMPLGIAKVIAKIGDVLGPWFPLNSDKLSKITSELTFDDSLARQNFGWDPKPVLAD